MGQGADSVALKREGGERGRGAERYCSNLGPGGLGPGREGKVESEEANGGGERRTKLAGEKRGRGGLMGGGFGP